MLEYLSWCHTRTTNLNLCFYKNMYYNNAMKTQILNQKDQIPKKRAAEMLFGDFKNSKYRIQNDLFSPQRLSVYK